MTAPTPDLAGAQLRPRAELLAMIDDLVMKGMSSGDRSPLLSLLSEAAERMRLDGAALSAPAGEDAQPFKDALRDLVMLKAQDEIGCVPAPTKDQWAKAWAEAEELTRVEP